MSVAEETRESTSSAEETQVLQWILKRLCGKIFVRHYASILKTDEWIREVREEKLQGTVGLELCT